MEVRPICTELRVRINKAEQLLMFDYEPGTEEALFDLCTVDGHILRTGDITGPVTRIRLTDVEDQDMVLMVIDGEYSVVQSVPFRKAV